MGVRDLFVVEWCPELGGLHFETVGTMLEKNQLAFTKGEAPGYVPLQIVHNSRDAMEAVREAKAFVRRKRKEAEDGNQDKRG